MYVIVYLLRIYVLNLLIKHIYKNERENFNIPEIQINGGQ